MTETSTAMLYRIRSFRRPRQEIGDSKPLKDKENDVSVRAFASLIFVVALYVLYKSRGSILA